MHIITLSFDDGFVRSFRRIAEMYEKFGLSACLNIVASNCQLWNPYHAGTDPGREHWDLWNELQGRGHEIMPHGLHHVDHAKLPFAEAQDSIRRCLDMFRDRLRGFDPQEVVFNFPYNSSWPGLERWLSSVVRAFRTEGDAINPLPHDGLTKLTSVSFGPGYCDAHLDSLVTELLSRRSGWLIHNTHGLDDEGWGPVRAESLERLLARLVAIPSVRILPAARALAEGPRGHSATSGKAK